jgi:integrase
MPRRLTRRAPTYLALHPARHSWQLRFRYVDSLGHVHSRREVSPWPTDHARSLAWAPIRRAEIIAEIEAELRRVDEDQRAPVTLGVVMAAYEADCRARGTRWEGSAEYRAAAILATLGAGTPAEDLTAGRVAAWRAELREGRARTIGEEVRPLTNRSLNAYVSLLRAALNHAVDDGLLPSSPLGRLKRLPEARRQPPALSERQLGAVLAALPAWERWAAELECKPEARPRVPLVARVLLGYYTGGRPEALDALRWRQIDLERRVLVYDAKGHRGIVVPLEPELLALLRALHSGRHSGADDLVLASPDTGRPVVNWRAQWVRVIRLAKGSLKGGPIRETTPLHALRHTRITHLLLAGVSPQAVAQVTGTSLAMLQRHYAHLMTRSLEAELARARRHPALRAIAAAERGSNEGSTRRTKTARKAPRKPADAKPQAEPSELLH